MERWMPHNSTITCIEISKIISSVNNMLANMDAGITTKVSKHTAFLHFPVTDEDLDTTRKKNNNNKDLTSH